MRGLASGGLNCLRVPDVYGFLRRKVTGTQVSILAYHRVCPERDKWFEQSITPDDFEKQIKYISKTFKVIHLDELASIIRGGKLLPVKAAVITLDDGHKDNYKYAYPILKKYRAAGIIFLATGYIDSGKLFPWDEVNYALKNTALETITVGGLGRYSLSSLDDRVRAAHIIWSKVTKLPEETKTCLIRELVEVSGVNVCDGLGKERVLSWDEIEEMSLNNIAFGSHTVNHPLLTRVSREQARVEIMQSKKEIEERLNKPVTAFAFPDGAYDPGTIEVLKETGFTCAVTTRLGMVTAGANPYELPRAAPGWTIDTLKISLSGLYPDMLSVLNRVRRT